jgi:hypothetical protein
VADDSGRAGGAQLAVAAGDGLVGDVEDLGDAVERCAAVDHQGVNQAPVQRVDFHHMIVVYVGKLRF